MMSHFVSTPAKSIFKIPVEFHPYSHHPGLSQCHSPLDYCCDLLTALPATTLTPSVSLHARVLSVPYKSDHVIPLLKVLQWLPPDAE